MDVEKYLTDDKDRLTYTDIEQYNILGVSTINVVDSFDLSDITIQNIVRIRQKAVKYIYIYTNTQYHDNSSSMFVSREYMNTLMYTVIQANNNRKKEN